MFKLVVLCAFFAAAAANPEAKPDFLVASPLQYSTWGAPISTTYSSQASSVIHPSPLVYSTPLTYSHFIKKRSPQWPFSYVTPTTYVSTNHLGTTTYTTTPLVHSTSIIPSTYTTTHLIKKRSAPLLDASYITPTYTSTYSAHSPFITTYSSASPLYSSTHLISSPSFISHPVSLAHFIKKRSAPLLTTYLSPAAVSHQSRVDVQSTPLITSYSTPITYHSPIALAHAWK